MGDGGQECWGGDARENAGSRCGRNGRAEGVVYGRTWVQGVRRRVQDGADGVE